MYRIYIQDRGIRLWLLDWIISDGLEHLHFSTNHDLAMIFPRFNDALHFHTRLRALGYEPHID